MRLKRWLPGIGARAFNGIVGWWGVPVPLRWRLLRASGAVVHPTSVIYPGHRGLGRGVTLARDTYLGPGFTRADYGALSIGEQVRIGPDCLVLTASHELGTSVRRAADPTTAPVVIHSGVWIGARVTILPGVTIGSGCVVAAGAVVTSDCAADGLYAGVPARRKRDL